MAPATNEESLAGAFSMNFYRERDSSTASQCMEYVRANRTRFRIVSDGWGGEDNFWEPTDFWLTRISASFPASEERNIIAFDLDFKEFIRQYDIDEEAKGMSCESYIDGLLKEDEDGEGPPYRDNYTDAEIDKWVPECVQNREKFEAGRKRILEKYGLAPFTKLLRDIDVTTIVIFHRVSC